MVQLHIYKYLFFFLEKEVAAPSSILAWKILWAEEPVRLQTLWPQDSDMTRILNNKKQCHEELNLFLVLNVKYV